MIHLAGEPIAARWTKDRRRLIRESRAIGTRFLAEALGWLERPPKVLVSASAIGIYGNRGDQVLTENDATLDAAPDFLTAVARQWEAATEPARAAGVRTVMPRFGIVLSPAGGALQRMLPAFRVGAGGPLGTGRQWMSWIAIDDLVGGIHHALMTEALAGPVNLTAPDPVTNANFAATLGRVLERPAVLPVPARGAQAGVRRDGRDHHSVERAGAAPAAARYRLRIPLSRARRGAPVRAGPAHPPCLTVSFPP